MTQNSDGSVSMCPYVIISVLPFHKAATTKEKLLFNGFCSIYSILSETGEQKYPAHGLTIQTKQMSLPLLVALLLQLATSYCRVLHSLVTSMFFVFVA